MRFFTATILLVFVAQAQADANSSMEKTDAKGSMDNSVEQKHSAVEDKAVTKVALDKQSTQDSVDKSVDVLANKLVEKMADRILKAAPHAHDKLDKATLGKPGHLSTPQLGASATAAAHLPSPSFPLGGRTLTVPHALAYKAPEPKVAQQWQFPAISAGKAHGIGIKKQGSIGPVTTSGEVKHMGFPDFDFKPDLNLKPCSVDNSPLIFDTGLSGLGALKDFGNDDSNKDFTYTYSYTYTFTYDYNGNLQKGPEILSMVVLPKGSFDAQTQIEVLGSSKGKGMGKLAKSKDSEDQKPAVNVVMMVLPNLPSLPPPSPEMVHHLQASKGKGIQRKQKEPQAKTARAPVWPTSYNHETPALKTAATAASPLAAGAGAAESK